MRRMDPNVALVTVVLVVASVSLAAWCLVGVVKDEVAGAQRSRTKHRR